MSKVLRKDTRQEILVRKKLFALGYRYRKNYKRLPGSPDIVLPKYKTAIFINGCFWHGHNCKYSKLPKSNIDFWVNKITRNKKRDREKEKELKQLGWKVIHVWQCQLKTTFNQSKRITAIVKILKKL